MENLKIAGTQSTPEIDCNKDTCIVEMRGDSYPENSYELFSPVMEWVKTILAESDQQLHFKLHLLYLNTSSVKAMMDIFDMLEEAHGKGRQVAVNWYYDEQNQRVGELAAEFREDCTFPFTIIEQVE